MHLGHAGGPTLRADKRAWTIMLSVLVPVVLATIVGVILLWPSAQAGSHLNVPSAMAPGVHYASATVTAVDDSQCEPEFSDGCARISATVDGTAGSLYVPPEALQTGIDPGDKVKVLTFEHLNLSDPGAAATGPAAGDPGAAASNQDADPSAHDVAQAVGADIDFVFVDFDRDLPVGLLAAGYALVVILVAGLKGLRALAGLVFAYGVMVIFMLPAVLEGKSAVLVATTSAAVIMLVVLYLAHGLSARTTTALLGTCAGIAITGALGWLMTQWAHLAMVYSEDMYLLTQSAHLSVSDLVICGILIAGLGVLNDVTITQAAAVWELAASDRHASRWQLYRRAMRIGRDHIASTVYTIAFAYAGGAFVSLLLISVYQRPFLQSLTTGELAIEVVSILVGSIGLVIAIPLTTAIAVMVVTSARARGATHRGAQAAVGAPA